MEDYLNSLIDEEQDGVVDHEDPEDATDEGSDESEDDELDESEDENEEELADPRQPPETNHGYAEARKKAEAEARIAREEALQAKKEAETLKNALKNFGYQGTSEEIADALEAQATGRSLEEVRSERIDEQKRLNDLIANHPAVIQAKLLSEQMVKQNNQAILNKEFANIRRLNPEIKNLTELTSLDKFGYDQEEFDCLIRGGMHIDEAFKRVSIKLKPGQQVQDTKNHIKQVNGAGNRGLIDVPKDVVALCKDLMPKATDKEIRAYYNNYRKENK